MSTKTKTQVVAIAAYFFGFLAGGLLAKAHSVRDLTDGQYYSACALSGATITLLVIFLTRK